MGVGCAGPQPVSCTGFPHAAVSSVTRKKGVFVKLEIARIKQQRWLTTSTTHLAQELITKIQCSGFKKFFKGNESLEDDEHSGWPLETDDD